MPAERAGYTVTMFIIDVSSSMGAIRAVEVEQEDGKVQEVEMTNLAWGLQYAKLKIQEMIFNKRKTDQCGVVIFGSEDTKNFINTARGGYESVVEYIPIAHPNAGTLAKLDALEASTTSGDAIDALIVGIDSQNRHLGTKKSWTRKIVLVTDGETPLEMEDWEVTTSRMNELNVGLVVVGVDFDDDELPYKEANKSNIKVRTNEHFYHTLVGSLNNGVVGTLAKALRENARPDMKIVRSALIGTVMRIGDVDARLDEAIEISVKASKCTALARPNGWKKFGLRERKREDDMDVDEDENDEDDDRAVYAPLRMRTDYFIVSEPDTNDGGQDEAIKEEDDDEILLDEGTSKDPKAAKYTAVEKEDLVRGFKYGTTYAPCPDGQFPRLQTRKGIDIFAFFYAEHFRRELCMGEVQYIFADPSSPKEQVALSSMCQAMGGGKNKKKIMAIARWVSKDGMDPKMGVLTPAKFDKVDCLLWSQMPFADDVREYSFASLDVLINKKGEEVKEHPYLPTDEQLDAMDDFVDAMDLMDAGEDDEGNRKPWFETAESYSPAVHRVKQAIFHSATVNDVATNPVPPPHPELLTFFEPPKRVQKRARRALEHCKAVFNVKHVPKRVGKAKKDGHSHAEDEDDNILLLDRKPERRQSGMDVDEPASASAAEQAAEESVTEDEDEEEELLLDKKKPASPPSHRGPGGPLPTPARSVSPGESDGPSVRRIISNAHPLRDFEKNIAEGDVVTKAVEDLSAIILEVVGGSSASRRAVEMLECMAVLRRTCLEEDEIAAWNRFMRDLKKQCLARGGNEEFWERVKEVGRDMSLISVQEAKRQGVSSAITENEAGEFIS
ncbi:SPOC domain-like protein [Agrocybe pediades]|nr:SPOC domain-like protein [Agrocybe pediades]